eukprot:TRINITY_DN12666_c0_g1_i1.p1 TRINITY_DN12666_c0_g1~~TRINITY_DN12666_c0_g1_i1.p1  ORF type:complete len:421 (+),score=64.82 TRINITY_DN12666_c0_g1_i1:2-1264(+)
MGSVKIMSGDTQLQHNANQSLLGFVPALILQRILDNPDKDISFPEKQTTKTVVMFADISGFTVLSESLSKRGSEGAELLAFALNRYMELLVKAIARSGGDIFKFAGDAMIVLWPPPQNDSDEELAILLRQAIQSALDIQAKLHDTCLIENIKLRVKIGFGVGEVTILHVGGVFNRAEYLAAGDPLRQAFESEHHAQGKGEVIVSNQVWERIAEFFEGDEIDENPEHASPNGPFFLITRLKSGVETVQMKADALLIRTRIKNEQIDMVKTRILRYIPAAVVPLIKLDQERWAGELRRLSVMFVNVGIDLSDAKTDRGLERIQKVIQTIQKCVYQQYGSLNKLLMDDKGSTLVIVFGFPPRSNQDDAVRSCLCAINLCNEMKKINTTISIGIASGTVFAGVVGSSGSRREYSVLGDLSLIHI